MDSKAEAPKRLLFDRRYGWVVDEWKEASEEALAGGRGMFCISAVAKALINTASHSINFAVKALERPDVFSPEALQASLGKELNKFKSSIRKSSVWH